MTAVLKFIRQTCCRSQIFVRNLQTNAPSVQRLPSVVSQLSSIQHTPWIWQKNDSLILPVINRRAFDLPSGIMWVPPISEPIDNLIIEAPAAENTEYTKQAARLIVIRKKKMKKHKLRKLRKRMKYEWAKVRQRRELKKEKEFQGGLIARCKEAETFSAEAYVQERLNKLDQLKVKLKAQEHAHTKTN